MDDVDLSLVRGLFFDFDGTLVDTEAVARAAWEDTFFRFGVPFPEALHASLVGRPDSQVVLLTALGEAVADHAPRPDLTSWRSLVDERAGQLPARRGVAELVSTARAHGCMLAVTSGATEDWVTGHLRRLGLLDSFDLVITGEDRPAKPDPAIYHEALERCRLLPSEVVAFEDSPPGVAAARAAGICCVTVAGTDPTGPDRLQGPFATFAARLSELPVDRRDDGRVALGGTSGQARS